ncbi:MAG: AMP-binding protein [Nitriliruptoraceae bacterium]
MSRPPPLAAVARPWLQAYPPGVPASYRIPEVPIPRLLDDAVRDFPQAVAVRRGHVSLTHVVLRDRVADLVTLLRELGVVRGDRLLVATGTTVTTPVVLLAAWRLGAIIVPLPPGNDRDRTAARAVEVVEATGAVGVLATRDRLQDLVAAGLEVDWALDTTDEGWLAPPPRFRLPRPRLPRRRVADGPVRDLGTAMAEVASAPVTLHGDGPVPIEAPALLIPRWRGDDRRAIVLTHANVVASTFQARLWVPDIQAGREHVVVAGDLLALGPMILGWLAGMLAGACVELVPPADAAGLARTIDRHRATLAVLAPAHVAALLGESEGNRYDLSSLRVVLATGAPLDPASALELERRTGGARVREGFGVSEAGPITHAQPVYGRTTPGAMGLPVTDTAAVAVDPDDHGRLRVPGEAGLLLLAGPQVSPGYWQDEVATAERFVDGWLITEDLVSVDADGVFTHLGRRDEVLTLPDGHLVAPRRVEALLERHPGVVRAGVTCDPSDGEVVALVRCQRRHRPSEDELLTYAREQLDPRSAPERVVLVDEIPETEAGGVARVALPDLLAER